MFFEIISGEKVDPSVQECIEGFSELEAKESDLQAALNETFSQVIKLQTRSLAGQGDGKELKSAQARLDDFQQKFEAIRSGQETIKEKLAARILADARHRLADGIPSEIAVISEERRGLWREFLQSYAKAATLYARIRGAADEVPRINFEFGGLGDDDRTLYIELLRKETPEVKQPSCDSRIDSLSMEASRLERTIDEFDPSAAVAEVLQKAGSRAYQLPAEAEYEPRTRSVERWSPEQVDKDFWDGEEGRALKEARYGGRHYEERRQAEYKKLLEEPEPVQESQ